MGLYMLRVERLSPDLFGKLIYAAYPGAAPSRSVPRFVFAPAIAEVKLGNIKLRDIYQTKEYAEVFNARYAFLISTEMVAEEIRRFLRSRQSILYYCVTETVNGYSTIQKTKLFILNYDLKEKRLFSIDEMFPMDIVKRVEEHKEQIYRLFREKRIKQLFDEER